MLEEHMPFTSAEISEIRLEEHESYSDGVTRVSITNPTEISKISKALSKTVVRQFESDEDPQFFIGCGGNNIFCHLILKDGTQWSINPRGLATITSPKCKEDILALSFDQKAVFGLLESNPSVPALKAQINEVVPTVYEKAYQAKEFQKSMTQIIPVDMYFDSDPILLPNSTYTCRMEWLNAKGECAIPIEIAATLYEEEPDSAHEVVEGTPLQVEGTSLTLPGNTNKYFVTVRAKFKDNNWVESIFSYRSSLYPTAFYDIPYGNDEGNVTLVRDDTGIMVTGTQNRKYVDFIKDLGLSPTIDNQQNLPVQNPFSMVFRCENKPYEFNFTSKGVTYNGKPYKVKNPQVIKYLYVPFDADALDLFERINYDLRGFLTKDVEYFTNKYQFNAEDIKEFTIVSETPRKRISYDMSSLAPEKIIKILDYVVLGNNWEQEDYYTLRRFYLSYEVVLKDGTSYEIGEKVSKNGTDTGWYTIQSDSPLASQYIESQEGIEQQRDNPIFGGIGMDDEGNIIIE